MPCSAISYFVNNNDYEDNDNEDDNNYEDQDNDNDSNDDDDYNEQMKQTNSHTKNDQEEEVSVSPLMLLSSTNTFKMSEIETENARPHQLDKTITAIAGSNHANDVI